MGTQITRLTRLAAAGLSAVLLFATTACAATSPAETEPDNKTSVPAPTGPINVVASLNQWGSLAAELGGDDVEVTSIVNSTNVDAHDFEPKTSDVAKLSKAQIIVANGAGYDSWATKSMTGHLLGAAGALEAIACVLAVKNNIVPPTINFSNLDPELDPKLNFTFNKAQEKEINVAISNTFGFGGHNACVVFKK